MVTRGHTSEVLDYALYYLVTRGSHMSHTWVTRQIFTYPKNFIWCVLTETMEINSDSL